MNIVCFTGWQQPSDALEIIAPGALHFDYAAYDHIERMFEALPGDADLAIGWSLGGQLLVRAVAGGHIKPKALLLLAPPFQFIADDDFPEGMPAATFQEFQGNYRAQPEETLRQFHTLLALGEAKATRIASALNATLQTWQHGLFWLDQLAEFSSWSVDFDLFPPTTLVHGMKDKVVDPAATKIFEALMPDMKLLLWHECAHAPHMHDPDTLRALIESHV